jgi:asparagine synthetase B (glutamine-hydrolysing)
MSLFDQYFFSEKDQEKAWDVTPHIIDVQAAVSAVGDCLNQCVKRAQGTTKPAHIGLLLSGGVDSSLLLALLNKLHGSNETVSFTAYANARDSDVFHSKEVVRHFGNPWVRCKIGNQFVDEYLPEAMALANAGLYVTTANLALIRCLKECERWNIHELWIGNGIDMMFGGGVDPQRFSDPKRDGENFHKDFWDYSMSLLINRFYRFGYPEMKVLAEKYKVRIVIPFGNLDAILCARSVLAPLLFKGIHDKYPVRLFAREIGVPQREAFRKKQALQLSSGMFDLLHSHMLRGLPELVADSISEPFTSEFLKHDPFLNLRLYLALKKRLIDS